MASLESPRFPVKRLVILFIIGLAGTCLRFAIATTDGLWLDELHTAWTTGGSLDQVAARADFGNQMPIYFWLLWCVRRLTQWFLVAEGNLSLRFLSVLSGCGVMMVGCSLVWTWTRCFLAVICAGLLMAVDTSLVFYSTEARPYAVMQLVALIQVGFYWAWLNRFIQEPLEPGGRSASGNLNVLGIGLAVSTALLVSIHVTSLWLPLCEVFFFIAFSCNQIRPWKDAASFDFRSASKSAMVIALMAAVLLVPSLLELKQTFHVRENWTPISNRTQLLADLDRPLRWGILMPVIGMCLLNLSQANHRGANRTPSIEQTRRDRLGWRLGFVGAWALIPVAGVWLLDCIQAAPLANVRYVQVGAAAIPIFSALAIGWLSRISQRVTLLVFVLIGSAIVNPWLLPLFSAKAIPQFRFEDWAAAIQEINRGSKQQPRPILLFANLLEDRHALSNTKFGFQEYLRFPLYGSPQLDMDSKRTIVYPTLRFAGLVQADIERVWQQGGAWVIVRGRDPLVSEIVSKIFDQVKQSGKTRSDSRPPDWRIEFARFEQSRQNDVKLFLLSRQNR
jgi:hypothetical protein